MPVAIILLAFAFLLHFCLPTYFKLHCKAFLAPTQKASYFIRKMDTSEHSALLSFIIRKRKIYLIIKPPNICGFVSHFLWDTSTSVPCSTLIPFSVIWLFQTFNPSLCMASKSSFITLHFSSLSPCLRSCKLHFRFFTVWWVNSQNWHSLVVLQLLLLCTESLYSISY